MNFLHFFLSTGLSFPNWAHPTRLHQAPSQCLTRKEQKALGMILKKLEEAVKENPSCLRGRDTTTCLNPLDDAMRILFEDRIMACSDEVD